MIKTIEPRSLLQSTVKTVEINDEIKNTFQEWKKLMKEKKEDISDVEIFFAGWIMANPMVRDMFKANKGEKKDA